MADFCVGVRWRISVSSFGKCRFSEIFLEEDKGGVEEDEKRQGGVRKDGGCVIV